MTADRVVAILELLEQRSGRETDPAALCEVAAEITGLTGAGIALSAAGQPSMTIGSSSLASIALLDLELTVGEGPCIDAVGTDRPVVREDLANPTGGRWPVYSPLALETGARSVFAFPVRIGAVMLGGMVLYADRPGALSDDQSRDAFTMAGVIARAILTMQAGAPPGEIALELEHEAAFQLAVHQAAGMVSEQGKMSVGDALVALRAHAFATDTSTSALAAQVVARTVAFDPQADRWFTPEQNHE